MRRLHVAVPLMIGFFSLPGQALAQQSPMRMVIGTNVACRAAPDTSAAVVLQNTLGDIFQPRDEARTATSVWYLDNSRVTGGSPGCWIYGPLTTEWSDVERALLAAADHALARTDQASFEDYVAVDNLLKQTKLRPHSDSTVIDKSPLLQLRRLQILEKASRAPGTFSTAVRRDPLKSAWFYANRDVLRFFEPAGSWLMTADVYWRLYERHRAAPLAEDIAWIAAEGAVPSDECDAPCVLDRINRTYARYWLAFPRGRRVDEALTRAQSLAEYAARAGCFGGSPVEVPKLAKEIRASLGQIPTQDRAPLLALLSQIEQRCASR